MVEDLIQLKKIAAEHAVRFIESGMVVGLGHGSTAVFAIRRIARLLDDGTLDNILGVPCSRQVAVEAEESGIPLTTLDKHPVIDVTIDGADEVTPELDLIKGGGGALLREKIVAQSSRREVIVVDETKLSSLLGTKFAVPVEVTPFGWQTQSEFLKKLEARVVLRKNDDGTLFETDHRNYILDCRFAPIKEPAILAEKLNSRAGIVEHGLFLSLATDVIVAGRGGISHLKRRD